MKQTAQQAGLATMEVLALTMEAVETVEAVEDLVEHYLVLPAMSKSRIQRFFKTRLLAAYLDSALQPLA